MDKSVAKQFLLEQQYNSSEENCTREDFLEMIPALLTILKDEKETSVFFLLALRHIPTGLLHININDLEQILLKDSLPAVFLQIKKIISQLDTKVGNLIENENATDMATTNIMSLIQTCTSVLNCIAFLLEKTLCQYKLVVVVGSKVPSILLCIPDMLMTVYSHCARNKSIYGTQESLTADLKKLYSTNTQTQTNYLLLLDEKVDLSDSQDTELVEESLEKLIKLGSVLLELEPSRAYPVFKTYCSVAIKYVENLRNTLHVTPAIHALAQYIKQYLYEVRTTTIPAEDPLQIRKNKLFRVFFKLILNLVEKYQGSLRDTHTCLITLLATMFDFKCDTDGEMIEAAANNLIVLCSQDPYFINELLRTDKLEPGFISLCVIVMRRRLENQAFSDVGDDNSLKLIELIIKSVSRMEAEHFLVLFRSSRYKQVVATSSALSLTLSSSDYNQLESLLFKHLLGFNPLTTLFIADVWCILLNSGPKPLFEATCVFLVDSANSWDKRVYNFQYFSLVAMLRRCFRDVKPASAKKMFVNRTLCYEKHPVLLKIAPEYLPTNPVSTNSPPPFPHSYAILQSLVSTSQLDANVLTQTLSSMDWGDPCADYIVDMVTGCLHAKLISFDTMSITELFQTIVDILASSTDPLIWLHLLNILCNIPPSCISEELDITEALFATLVDRVNEDQEDVVNKAITNYIRTSAVAEYLDKSAFRRVLKKSGKVTLVQKYVKDTDPCDVLSQLGTDLQMQCMCEESPQEGHETPTEDSGNSWSVLLKSASSCDDYGNKVPNEQDKPLDTAGRMNANTSVKSSSNENSHVASNIQGDTSSVKSSSNENSHVGNNIQGDTSSVKSSSNQNSHVASNIQGELKCRDNAPDLNKSKRIKLEENGQLDLEAEKMLIGIKRSLQVLSERKLNPANRSMLLELGEYINNISK